MAVDDSYTKSLMHFDDIANTTLTGAIDASQTTITLAAATGIEAPYWVDIDAERLKCTEQSGSTLTVLRAQLGTTASSHNSGAGVAAFGLKDESGKIWAPYGGATISTARSRFGRGSLYLNGNQYLQTPDSADWHFGGDFAIEAWLCPEEVTKWHAFISQRYVVPASNCFTLYTTPNGGLDVEYEGGNLISFVGSAAWVAYQWYHVAICRYANTLMFYRDGVQVGGAQPFTVSLSDYALPLTLGTGLQRGVPADSYIGFIDEPRISKDVARWTSNFTPPQAPYASGSQPNPISFF